MLRWRQADLFEASKVPAPTIEAFEVKPESARMMGANMRALIAAFEAAGLEFIPGSRTLAARPADLRFHRG